MILPADENNTHEVVLANGQQETSSHVESHGSESQGARFSLGFLEGADNTLMDTSPSAALSVLDDNQLDRLGEEVANAPGPALALTCHCREVTSASLMAFENRPKFHPENHNNIKSVEILSQLPVMPKAC